jgi:NitT/TauT family transport system substrate-binding protein
MLVARVGRLCVAAVLVLLVGSCGLFGGSADDAAQIYGNPSELEKPDVTAAVLPTLDSVPVRLALEEGLFQDEGLNVKLVNGAQGAGNVLMAMGGAVDFAFTSYTPAILAAANGVQVRIVADSSALAPGNSVIMAVPESGVRKISDLRGRRVGVVGRSTMAYLLVAAVLDANDVPLTSVEFVEKSFPDTLPALDSGNIAAALLTEPFATRAAKDIGAKIISETSAGAMEEISLTGYVASGRFVRENPKTVAAFSRALQRASNLAAKRRDLVEPIAAKAAKTDRGTASIMRMTVFRSALPPKQLRRVIDAMVDYDMLDARVAARVRVCDMIVAPAPISQADHRATCKEPPAPSSR